MKDYLDSCERAHNQESLKNAIDELEMEILDVEHSTLTSPNEEETNNLGSNLHTIDEDEL